MIRAMLVDDEQPARDRLRSMLAEFADLQIVGEAEEGEEAIRKIAEARPNLVFLDIQMPGMTGMQVAAALDPPRPRVIFCTAFDQYAVDAFEQHAVDYLLKPLKRERLAGAIERVRRSVSEGGQSEAAGRTQARLLPQSTPAMRTLEYCGVCRSALEVGGDYYDFLSVGEGRLGVALGDVSGKGMFAGLLAASLQARLQSLAPLYGGKLESMFGELGRLMHASTDSNRYATLFYGVYEDAARELVFVNAAHHPPMVFPSDGGPMRHLPSGGTGLGMLPDARYRQDSLKLDPGDLLVICSDGVTETLNRHGEQFGADRLTAAVRRQAGAPVTGLRDGIVEEVDRFRGGAAPTDDLTLVVARVG